MPLNNRIISNAVLEGIKSIPYDRDGNVDTYQTKVEMYDDKCGGCGFACQIVNSVHTEVVFHDLKRALSYAQKTGYKIIRSCDYPSDVFIRSWHSQGPTLNEIIINGCQFWNEDKLDKPEGIFVELNIVNKNEELSQQRNTGVGIIDKVISQQAAPV